MKREFLIPLIVLILTSLACNFGARPANPTEKPAQIPAVVTSTVMKNEEATVPPSAQPTATGEASPTLPETETPAPTAAAAGPATFKDTFDQQNSDWSDPLIVTTQAAGHEPYVKITVDGGFMRFSIQENETYVYKFLQKAIEGAATIEVDFQNKGAVSSGIALVCKANQEMTSWYEVRVSASNSYYNFYQYDKKLKEEEGKNPYVLLGKGHMKIDEYYPTKPNHIALTCNDGKLSIDLNGKKQVSQDLETSLDGNRMGVGVMSADVLPVTIDFDTVEVH